jgi:hypothetical protein
MDELDANAWIELVQQDCEFPDVLECLERHGVSLAQVQWVDGTGSIALPNAGVILHLSKRDDDIFVSGVEFAVSGLPDGGSYDGSLPHGIDGADTLMDLTLKLHPAVPSPGKVSHSFDAVFPEHRLVIRMDDDDMLQSLQWMSTREMRGA